MIINKEEAKELYPLALLLADTGKEVGDFFGIKIYSSSKVKKREAYIIEK